jgi:hypothetical protein
MKIQFVVVTLSCSKAPTAETAPNDSCITPTMRGWGMRRCVVTIDVMCRRVWTRRCSDVFFGGQRVGAPARYSICDQAQ